MQALVVEKKGSCVSGDKVETTGLISIAVALEPVPTQLVLTTSRIEWSEDTLIDIGSAISVSAFPGGESNEVAYLVIHHASLPTQSILYFDGAAQSPDVDGNYIFDSQSIGLLRLMPPPQSNEDFSITMEAWVYDTVSMSTCALPEANITNKYETSTESLQGKWKQLCHDDLR